jgi:hypothetical protein
MAETESPQMEGAPAAEAPRQAGKNIWLQFLIFAWPFLLGLVLMIVFLAAGYAIFAKMRGETPPERDPKSGGNVACSGISIPGLTPEFYGFVKDAAAKYLNGDEAHLIAMIQNEAGWYEKAKNTESSASGLGQFLNSSAKGWPEFIGGDDKHGTNWPTGSIFQLPNGSFDSLTDNQKKDSRFEGKRSIYAAAHYMSNIMSQRNKDFITAYRDHYSGGNASAASKVESYYQKYINGGGCDVLNIINTLPVAQTGGIIDYPRLVTDKGIGGKALKASRRITWHKYELYRPNSKDLAEGMLSAAFSRNGKGLPEYRAGGVLSADFLTRSNNWHECAALIYFALNNNGFSVGQGELQGSKGLGDTSKFTYISSGSVSTGQPVMKRGDVIHFLSSGCGDFVNRGSKTGCSPYGTGNAHWAIAY